MVIWLVGLSGSGKSTLGAALCTRLRQEGKSVVHVDGDIIRAFCNDAGDPNAYSLDGRRRNAERIAAICTWLDTQKVNVVCSILAIFPDILLANRTRYSSYREVFLNPSQNVLRTRDTKGLYQAAAEGRMANVVGVHIPFPPPSTPDFIFDTGRAHEPPELHAEQIMQALSGSDLW